MTPKSITLHALTGLLPSYGRVAVKVKAKPPDSLHLGDLSTKHVATNGQGMRILVVADVPYASARSKGTVPIPCAAGSREKRDFSDEPCAIFLLNFQVASQGFRSQPHRHSRREVAMSAILPAIQYPTPNSFPRFRVASKAHDVDLSDGIELATARSRLEGRSQP